MSNAAKATEKQDENTDSEDRPITLKELRTLLSEHGKETSAEVNRIISAREKRAAKPKASSGDESEGEQSDPVNSKIAKLEKMVRESQEAAKAAERKSRLTAAESVLREKLSRTVRPEAMGALVKVLRADGAFDVDDDGNPVIRVADKGGEPLEFGLDDGLSRIAKNPEFSLFFSAPTQGGSGANAVKRPQGAAPSYLSKPQHEWSSAEREAEYDRQVELRAAEKSARQQG